MELAANYSCICGATLFLSATGNPSVLLCTSAQAMYIEQAVEPILLLLMSISMYAQCVHVRQNSTLCDK